MGCLNNYMGLHIVALALQPIALEGNTYLNYTYMQHLSCETETTNLSNSESSSATCFSLRSHTNVKGKIPIKVSTPTNSSFW